MTTTGSRPLVAGIGDRWHGDDGVGAAVAADLRSAIRDVDVVEVPGRTGRLAELWAGRSLAVVVAPTRCGGIRGRIRRVEISASGAPPDDQEGSADLDDFGADLAETCRRALAEGTAPTRLVLYGVEAGPVHDGLGLSLLVAAAVPAVVRAVTAEVGVVASI